MSQNPQALDVSAIEAELATRRSALLEDASALGAFLAPEHLKGMANEVASSAVADAKSRALEAIHPSTMAARFNRLLDDARDGDPTSLGVVTVAALGLISVSLMLVVRATRR